MRFFANVLKFKLSQHGDWWIASCAQFLNKVLNTKIFFFNDKTIHFMAK